MADYRRLIKLSAVKEIDAIEPKRDCRRIVARIQALSDEPIVKGVSHGWNANVGYCATGIAEITILDAEANGYWPLENAAELIHSAA